MNFRILVRNNLDIARCPACNSIAALKKSRSGSLPERAAKLMNFRAFICTNCGWRGMFFKHKLAKNGMKVIMIYVTAIFISVLIVYYMLGRVYG